MIVQPSIAQENNSYVEDGEQDSSGEQKSNSSNCITGFYGGADMGLDVLKVKLNDTTTGTTAKKGKGGLLLDVFSGYNCQLGSFIYGIEGFLDFRMTKNSTKVGVKTVSSRKKYGFGLAPKIGYNIYNDLNGYANFGLLVAKYKIRSADNKSTPLKTSFFAGIGFEQSFGSLFVRGELNKIFRKTIANVGGIKTSVTAYVFKIGGGYRF
ncbi:MAG: hypothetical protein LBB34_00755 [Holosporales bacterium]|jgi:hypothetical protein|nr:hypothetical protein [Holosporales bacterium]